MHVLPELMSAVLNGDATVEGPVVGAPVELPDDAIPLGGKLERGGLVSGADMTIYFLAPSENGGSEEK